MLLAVLIWSFDVGFFLYYCGFVGVCLTWVFRLFYLPYVFVLNTYVLTCIVMWIDFRWWLFISVAVLLLRYCLFVCCLNCFCVRACRVGGLLSCIFLC